MVNFGVKDERFRITTMYHGIEFEDKFFNEHKVERLTV